jgi:hypothetical protein
VVLARRTKNVLVASDRKLESLPYKRNRRGIALPDTPRRALLRRHQK